MTPVFVFTGLLVILQPFHIKEMSIFLKGSIMEVTRTLSSFPPFSSLKHDMLMNYITVARV